MVQRQSSSGHQSRQDRIQNSAVGRPLLQVIQGVLEDVHRHDLQVLGGAEARLARLPIRRVGRRFHDRWGGGGLGQIPVHDQEEEAWLAQLYESIRSWGSIHRALISRKSAPGLRVERSAHRDPRVLIQAQAQPIQLQEGHQVIHNSPLNKSCQRSKYKRD